MSGPEDDAALERARRRDFDARMRARDWSSATKAAEAKLSANLAQYTLELLLREAELQLRPKARIGRATQMKALVVRHEQRLYMSLARWMAGGPPRSLLSYVASGDWLNAAALEDRAAQWEPPPFSVEDDLSSVDGRRRAARLGVQLPVWAHDRMLLREYERAVGDVEAAWPPEWRFLDQRKWSTLRHVPHLELPAKRPRWVRQRFHVAELVLLRRLAKALSSEEPPLSIAELRRRLRSVRAKSGK